MQHKPGEEWQDIQDLRRKGVTAREFWEFLFRSPPHLCVYEQSPKIGPVIVGMWRLLLNSLWDTFYASWETTATENSSETSWWNVLKTFPEDLCRHAFSHLRELLETVSQEQEMECCIPALLEALQKFSPFIQTIAAQTLQTIQSRSPEIYTSLLPLLKTPEGTLRREILCILQPFASQYPSLLDEILPLTRDPDIQLREQAIRSLGFFPEVSEKVIPILQQTLESGAAYPYLQNTAVVALGNLGIAHLSILPHLKLIAKGPFNLTLRRETVHVLGKLDEKENQLLLFFLDLMDDPDIEVRRYAIHSLRRKGSLAFAGIPALLKAMEDPEDEIRRETAPTLGKIKSSCAVPLLIKTLEDSNDIVKRNAAKALGYIGPEALEAIPALFQKISDTDEYFFMNLVEALQCIGADPSQIESAIRTRSQIPETRDQLLLWMKSSIPEQRIYASWALGYGVSLTASVGTALTHALTDPHPWVRRNSVWSLGNFGSQASGAIFALIGLLTDPSIDVCRNTARALGNIGDPQKEVIEILWNLNPHEDKHFRFWRAIALGKLKSHLFRIVPVLQEALEDEDYYYVRKNAAQVLGSLGKVASPAIPQLTKALQDISPEVRKQARFALEQITGEEYDFSPRS